MQFLISGDLIKKKRAVRIGKRYSHVDYELKTTSDMGRQSFVANCKYGSIIKLLPCKYLLRILPSIPISFYSARTDTQVASKV